MNTTEQVTENPPAETHHPKFTSSRHVFPKTPEDRRTVESFIKQAYHVAHTDNHEIAWRKVKVNDPELYDDILYWCADNFQRIYSVTNDLRKTSELPDNLRKIGNRYHASNGHSPQIQRPKRTLRLKGQIDPKFAGIDKWLLSKHESFEHEGDGNRISWHKVFDRFPSKEAEAAEIWNTTDRAKLRGLLRDRLVRLLERHTNGDSPKDPQAEPTSRQTRWSRTERQESELKKLINEAIRLGLRSDGVLKLAAVKKEHPELWSKISAFFPTENRVYKSIMQRVSYLKKTGKLSVGGNGSALAHRETIAEPKSPRVEIPATEFRFTCCPICRQDVRSVEETIMARISLCPRCGFQIEKAEQAYIALLTIKP